ncbi:MAG TPA: glucokinase [candidate division Zixibacteria bacterium]|nr:glucokinase [candidate division Zixibacteria bacterium]
MARKKLILAGDIGGTKTHLAFFAGSRRRLRIEAEATFASARYPGLEAVLREFLAGHDAALRAACFGVAGPVVAGTVKTPNLPWVVDAAQIASLLGLRAVTLLNDLEAAAYGIFTLAPEDLACLNDRPVMRPANRALIAAGTGLGEAILYDDGAELHPLASEGGHADFAPRNETEIELLRYLAARFGHVSYERVVSGPGLFNIYRFLRDSGRCPEPAEFADRLAAGEDPGVAITQAALSGGPEICVQALDLFISIYGAEAGNLALKAKAFGGVYVGGGIAPRIERRLREGEFVRAFADKGRYRELLAAVPIHVIMNERAALQGAAYFAARRRDG